MTDSDWDWPPRWLGTRCVIRTLTLTEWLQRGGVS